MALFLTGCLSSDQSDRSQSSVDGSSTATADTHTAALTAPYAPPATWKLSDLNGATTSTVQSLLGQPAFVRADPPALYWRFGDKTCALDVYLYTGTNGAMQVQHTELRHQTEATAASTSCLDHLRRTLIADTAE